MIDHEVGKKQYHYATVVRISDDPKSRGAIFIQSDTLTNGTEWTDPVQPSFPLAGKSGEGFFWVPQIGDQVEVEIDLADEHPVPKYIRMIYSDQDDIADEFKTNYPFRMGWKTRAGHILYFDNKEDFFAIKLMHVIGTGFEWDKDGNEIKKIIGDLRETIEKKVLREVKGQVEELFKAEVKRIYDGKVQHTFKKDLVEEIQGALKQTIKKEFKVDANGAINISGKDALNIMTTAMAKVLGNGGTDIGSGSSITNVFGQLVNLAGGGLPVALVGSQCIGIGNLGGPVVSTIVFGATKVTAN